MIQDIKSGEKCVLGGGGGQVILLVVSRGGGGVKSIYIFFGWEGGGVRQNLGNESRSQPAPRHLNNERSLSTIHNTRFNTMIPRFALDNHLALRLFT